MRGGIQVYIYRDEAQRRTLEVPHEIRNGVFDLSQNQGGTAWKAGAQRLLVHHIIASNTVEEFTLQTKDAKGNLYTSCMRLFEPTLSGRRRMSLLIPELRLRGFLKESHVGRLQVILLNAHDVLAACRSMAQKGRFCYLPLVGKQA
jgi:hypothetical protein